MFVILKLFSLKLLGNTESFKKIRRKLALNEEKLSRTQTFLTEFKIIYFFIKAFRKYENFKKISLKINKIKNISIRKTL